MQKSTQTGFTLIELVVVIVILGILAVTALPKFIDLSDEANTAAVQGVAGALSSASSINYAARKANSAKGSPFLDCATAAPLVLQTGLPAGYSATGTVPNDAAGTCTVGNGTSTATATVIGIN
jgi:prepilin-type N-terminal cleavage/methylation domain-containing protein